MFDPKEKQAIADLIFPGVTVSPEQYEQKYPQRRLPAGAIVTRFAPSPTGEMQMGNLFANLIEERLAHQSAGVFFLRIEDTDNKREIKNGVAKIITAVSKFNVNYDEGPLLAGEGQVGDYGPYRQSLRKDIYLTYAKKLVAEDKAYPCFCTAEEGAARAAEQKAHKYDTIGYYGKWAVCRDMSLDAVKMNIAAGKPFVLRLKAADDTSGRIVLNDIIRGTITLPVYGDDRIFLKSDGMPTYHFAHAVDDHLMRTTHVLRGDEWLPSVPFHFRLFEALNFKLPVYGHIAPLMKMDGDSKRKLSKRKDPEAALEYYHELGYDVTSVMEYLMTILNSNFEDWRRANPDKPYTDFPVSTAKMSRSGALFDIAKLNDVSRNTIAVMSAGEVLSKCLAWAALHDAGFSALLTRDPAYAEAILSIDRGGAKPRKDITRWSDVREYTAYFYDELFTHTPEMAALVPDSVGRETGAAMLADYADSYQQAEDNQAWFAGIRDLAVRFGYAGDMKSYKNSPEAFKGHVGDVSTLIRVALTGRTNTPDLFMIMKMLGPDRVKARMQNFIGLLNT